MKKIPRRFYILTTFVVLGIASALHAQSPQNPFPISGPMTITTPGYYRFTRSVIFTGLSGNVITIQTHNVTIDFNSFFIVAPKNVANNVIGISAREYGNLTIKNGTIAFCKIGIQLDGNNNSSTTLNINQVIDNMRISNCWEYGIYFPAISPGSLVSNCLFSQIGGSTAITSSGVAIFGPSSDPTILVRDNIINKVTGTSGNPTSSFGIAYAFAVRNSVANSSTGIYGGKYQNNLTSGCTTPFTGGTDAGGNN